MRDIIYKGTEAQIQQCAGPDGTVPLVRHDSGIGDPASSVLCGTSAAVSALICLAGLWDCFLLLGCCRAASGHPRHPSSGCLHLHGAGLGGTSHPGDSRSVGNGTLCHTGVAAGHLFRVCLPPHCQIWVGEVVGGITQQQGGIQDGWTQQVPSLPSSPSSSTLCCAWQGG